MSLISNNSSLQSETKSEQCENTQSPNFYLNGCGVSELLSADFFDDVVWEACLGEVCNWAGNVASPLDTDLLLTSIPSNEKSWLYNKRIFLFVC